MLARAPRRECDDEGTPVTVLTIAPRCPEGRYATESWKPATYEVDVLDAAVGDFAATLPTDTLVSIVGQLAADGRIRAKSVEPAELETSAARGGRRILQPRA